MSATLWTSAMLAIVAAGIFAFAARTVLARPTDPASRPGVVAFALWWAAVALATLVAATTRVAGATGVATLPLALTLFHVSLLALCVAAASLCYYFLFLRWGRGHVAACAGLYGVLYAYYLHTVLARDPIGVSVGSWRVELVYAAASSTRLQLVSLALLVGPPIVGALLYWPLVSAAPDPAARRRGRLVALAIIGWFSGSFLVSVVPDPAWRAVLSQVSGIVAALVVLAAYHPPGVRPPPREPPHSAPGRSHDPPAEVTESEPPTHPVPPANGAGLLPAAACGP